MSPHSLCRFSVRPETCCRFPGCRVSSFFRKTASSPAPHRLERGCSSPSFASRRQTASVSAAAGREALKCWPSPPDLPLDSEELNVNESSGDSLGSQPCFRAYVVPTSGNRKTGNRDTRDGGNSRIAGQPSPAPCCLPLTPVPRAHSSRSPLACKNAEEDLCPSARAGGSLRSGLGDSPLFEPQRLAVVAPRFFPFVRVFSSSAVSRLQCRCFSTPLSSRGARENGGGQMETAKVSSRNPGSGVQTHDGNALDLQRVFEAMYLLPDDDACHASVKKQAKRRHGRRSSDPVAPSERSQTSGASTSPSSGYAPDVFSDSSTPPFLSSRGSRRSSASSSPSAETGSLSSAPPGLSPSTPPQPGMREALATTSLPRSFQVCSGTQEPSSPHDETVSSPHSFPALPSPLFPCLASCPASPSSPGELPFRRTSQTSPSTSPRVYPPPSSSSPPSWSSSPSSPSCSVSLSSEDPGGVEDDLDNSDPIAWFLTSASPALASASVPSKPTPPRLSRRRTLARAASALPRDRNSWMSQPEVLIKMLFKASQNNVRDANLWKVFVQRVSLTAVHMNAHQLALTLYAFARVRYFDARLLHTLAPFILKLLDDFSPQGLSLVLNAFKKLHVHKYDTIELIANQVCLEIHRCSAQDLALAANSLAFFYVYHAKFWKLLLKHLPRVGPQLTPQHAAMLVAAFARIDLRDGSALLLLSRILKKHSLSLDQARLSVAVSAFSKLDFTHPKLTISFHKAVHHLFAEDPDPFDAQALCLLLHSIVCLTGGSEHLIRRLLVALVRKSPSLAVHQMRKLRHTAIVFQAHHPDLYEQLDDDVRRFLTNVRDATPKELGDHGSRWAVEVACMLQEMGILFQRRLYANGCRIDILLPEKKTVIMCAGPHHFYLDSTRRTAYSRLQQRLLELQGYSVCVLPYYEWSELQNPEEKQRFLWTFGRRAAAEIQATHASDDYADEETSERVAYANTFSEDPVELALTVEEAFDEDMDSGSDSDLRLGPLDGLQATLSPHTN
ncbi:RAP domain-containing protein [Toxoplasma gondii ME49]|uniref:RAP domain-containing protein n=2 Tax=Toxoplasma gondii TaxID=5811 RepID=A0A086KMA9_TOXGO|nr:RAP domain-containing protein [Toxoplasma gondii ME49]EPT27059.1 RAP domain-containing protein [Toxoplasma gondii ME49]KFG45527.1 RAP domain-containing protein [Toxoplasma gondii GAB2-2007-GAL-DOM2]|eukprot:XP_002366224.2 RAP domain-containing protein [Toxoplasma gondii ME49]